MEKLVLIDGNSIANRAFYGIMGSKMLTTRKNGFAERTEKGLYAEDIYTGIMF